MSLPSPCLCLRSHQTTVCSEASSAVGTTVATILILILLLLIIIIITIAINATFQVAWPQA